jgi:hypothetical protein
MAKKTVKPEVPAKAKKAAPAAKPAVAKKTAAPKNIVDRDAIVKKAEEIYRARVARGESGTADGDWHLAEQLLKGKGKPAVKKEAAKKPAVKKEVAKKPAAKKPAVKKPAAKKK